MHSGLGTALNLRSSRTIYDRASQAPKKTQIRREEIIVFIWLIHSGESRYKYIESVKEV